MVLPRGYLAAVVVAPVAAVVSVAPATATVVVTGATVVLVDFFLLQPVARIGMATAIAAARTTFRMFTDGG